MSYFIYVAIAVVIIMAVLIILSKKNVRKINNPKLKKAMAKYLECIGALTHMIDSLNNGSIPDPKTYGHKLCACYYRGQYKRSCLGCPFAEKNGNDGILCHTIHQLMINDRKKAKDVLGTARKALYNKSPFLFRRRHATHDTDFVEIIREAIYKLNEFQRFIDHLKMK